MKISIYTNRYELSVAVTTLYNEAQKTELQALEAWKKADFELHDNLKARANALLAVALELEGNYNESVAPWEEQRRW